MTEKTVFVLGAGFTRAFVPQAPLLVDDYDIPRLRQQFASFPHASAILDAAPAGRLDGRIDLEQLLTRLTGMPYDTPDANRELGLLDSTLRKALVARIKSARAAGVRTSELGAFARAVLKNNASIVTFNYDDVLDEALWRVNPITTRLPFEHSEPYWHPDGGYGFFCRPSITTVSDSQLFMDLPTTLVLKLHGSINWYPRLGENTPLTPYGLLHHEDWFELPPKAQKYAADRVRFHLEPDAFIVPPVLVKAELSAHPVLRVIWELAHRKLAEATQVVFIGYSLPVTDLASRMLFQETLANRTDVDLQVVSLATSDEEKAYVRHPYRSLFKNIRDSSFDFGGALEWVARVAGGEMPQAASSGGSEKGA